MTEPTTPTITEPGVYDGFPEQAYHADPTPQWSLSASGAKLLLRPSTPAHYLWSRQHPRTPTKTMDLGTIAHQMVLGVGGGIAIIPDDILAKNGAASTGEAKAFIAEAKTEGKTAVKTGEHAELVAMIDALRRHPIAGKLFDPERGRPEQSMFWRDDRHGIWRRARLDWLPNPGKGRAIIADYKTARSADPTTWAKAAADLSYHLQDANYRAGLAATTGLRDKDIAFVFVVQESAPPYPVSVIELDQEARLLGADLMDRAAHTFAHCIATNTWPGYSNEVVQTPLPGWYVNRIEQELEDAS